MTVLTGIWSARIWGALAGIVAAGALLFASHPAQGGDAVGAEVTVHADVTGELGVSPTGPADFIHVRTLRPGQEAAGSFTVTNQTGQAQRVGARALPSDPHLASVVKIEFDHDGRVVLGPGESGAISARVRVSPTAGSRWQAALIDYAVLLDSKDAG
jgi:hypothetical protein